MYDRFIVLEKTIGRISKGYDMWVTNIDVDVGFVKIEVVAEELIVVGGLPVVAVLLTPTKCFSTLIESVSLGPRRPIWQIRGLAFRMFNLGFKGSEPLDLRVAPHVARVVCVFGAQNVLLDKI